MPHDPDGVLAVPDGEPRCAVLVLAGSSGRVETRRVRLLARHGAAAASIRWFGGHAQSPGICEVPLETFGPILDRLADQHERLAVIGTSKGAEAALLIAARDQRVRVVAALSPSSVVWANVGPGRDGAATPPRSSWTDGGTALPFVPYDPEWTPDDGALPAYRGLYERSLITFADRVEAATIPVERISGDVLLAAGGDDQVWPAVDFAQRIVDRRAARQRPTTLLTDARAGHRVRLPGEPDEVGGGQRMARGGTDAADRALGRLVWRELVSLLDLAGGQSGRT